MEEIIMTLLKIVIMIIVPVATSVLTYFSKKYLNILIDRVAKDETALALKQGVNLIVDSVNYIQQTYVDVLKKEDKFTLEAQEEALQAAKNRAIELMNDDITTAIKSNYGNIDTYVITIIESIINSRKTN